MGKWFRRSADGKNYRLDRACVGLVAGWGSFPVVVAEALRSQGVRICCVGVEDHADPVLEEICDEFQWCGLSKLGKAVRFLQKHGVREATMAGKIYKIRMYEPWRWWRYTPDWATVQFLYRLLRQNWKDDSLLLGVVDTFARGGVKFLPATDFAPELLVKQGRISRRAPTSAQWNDVLFGWEMAKEMGRLDVGQSVVVKDKAVLAVEAIEGTDACIRRAGALCRSGGFTVVKVAKPSQDMRFDVPTVGIGTLETLHAAGGSVLAIEADRTIFLDREAVVKYADQHRLVVVAVHDHARQPLAADVAHAREEDL